MQIKVPFYNLVNIFLTGLIFLGICVTIFPDVLLKLLKSEIMSSVNTGSEIILTTCTFAIAYEIGLIINRIGSVILEPFLKKFKLIPFN